MSEICSGSKTCLKLCLGKGAISPPASSSSATSHALSHNFCNCETWETLMDSLKALMTCFGKSTEIHHQIWGCAGSSCDFGWTHVGLSLGKVTRIHLKFKNSPKKAPSKDNSKKRVLRKDSCMDFLLNFTVTKCKDGSCYCTDLVSCVLSSFLPSPPLRAAGNFLPPKVPPLLGPQNSLW